VNSNGARVMAQYTSTSGSSAGLRQANSRTVLDVIKRSLTPLRLAEIVHLTGLSRPTVETVTEGLLQQGWVAVDQTAEPTADRRPGRPARQYSFNAAAGYVIGVDIGAHSLAVCVSDLRGSPRATMRRSISPTTRAPARLRVVSTEISRLLATEAIEGRSVLAVTVGTPGIVSLPQGRISKSPGMPGWAETDVAAALHDAIGLDIELENDANLAAIGERARGTALGCADMLFLLLGERLGAGVIANGSLVRGHNGAAGEVGYAPAAPMRRRTPGFGALESTVNASALLAIARLAVDKHTESDLARLCGGPPAQLTAEAITVAATAGDRAAIGVLRTLARGLARGVAPSLLTLNPEVLVLGGGISRAGGVLRDMFASQIEDLTLYPPEVRLSALGDEAVLWGAIEHSIARVEHDVLSRVSA